MSLDNKVPPCFRDQQDSSVPLRTGTCYTGDILCCFCKIIVLCSNY